MTSVLSTLMDAFGSGPHANILYAYLLDSCEKTFDSEMDQGSFEEHMRWFFGVQVCRLCRAPGCTD
jgi:paired amphipathic helix protein Sin3a